MTDFNPGGAASLDEAVKLRYEANPDTNAFTDAEKAKLAGVEPGANAYVHPSHTGDVTGAGALAIAPNAVTFAKMQALSGPARLIGRGAGGPGDPEEIALGAGLVMTGTTLSAPGGGIPEAPLDGWPYARLDGAWVRTTQSVTFVKTSDEARSGTAAFADDSQIAGIPILANSQYRFEMILAFEAGTVEDFKARVVRASGLADASLFYASDLDNNSAPRLIFDSVNTGAGAGLGSANLRLGSYIGYLISGTEAGTIALQWAQNTAGATATTLRAGSAIFLRRLS